MPFFSPLPWSTFPLSLQRWSKVFTQRAFFSIVNFDRLLLLNCICRASTSIQKQTKEKVEKITVHGLKIEALN